MKAKACGADVSPAKKRKMPSLNMGGMVTKTKKPAYGGGGMAMKKPGYSYGGMAGKKK